MRRALVAASAVVLAFFLAAGASAKPRVVVKSTSTGLGATATVRVAGVEPSAEVSYRVSAKPRQRVRITWRVSCVRGRKNAALYGVVTGRAPIERVVRHPSGAETCTVTVTGQIWKNEQGELGTGLLTVTLLES